MGKAGVMSCEGIVSVGVGASTLAQPEISNVITQSKSDIIFIKCFIYSPFIQRRPV